MYTYYLLAIFGPKMQPFLWWKRYLTDMQLAQFAISLINAMLNVAGVVKCGFPWQMSLLNAVFMIYLMIMFGNFYIKSYIQKKPKQH